ncbi:MAG: GAF domain-containing protein [Betaproteobacteria bacterium]
MTPGTSTGIVAAAEAPGPDQPAVPRRVHRGRLFRKYLLLILSLVTIALLASGATSIYFSYQDNKAALASLQHEKAIAAASRIEQYIRQISQQLGYASLPQLDAGDVELRRVEFLKLLRQAPEVTDIAQLDAAGREQIAVSRLGMDVVASGKDRSQEPAFRNAKRGQPWYGPVYFRKETEPYMTIAIRSGSDSGPVTVADVNLKFIWDVVSRIKIGEKGKAYVIDRGGFLVADPDIGLVLRKTSLSELAHVKAAMAGPVGAEPAMVSHDLAGTPVLASVAPIESLDWRVFVEQPVAEVYEKLDASIVRTGLLLLGGLIISALAAMALARGMARPIRVLDEGARRIGEGDLDGQIVIHTGDELEGLANQFNRMTAQLRESYASLERKVEERTEELSESLDYQTAISEVLRVISQSAADVAPVFEAIMDSAMRLFGTSIAAVFRYDGRLVHLEGTRNWPAEALEDARRNYPAPPNPAMLSGRVILSGRVQTISDAHADPDYDRTTANVGQWRRMIGAPMLKDGVTVGVVVVAWPEPGETPQKQADLLRTFADQAVIAIENARLFNETKEALEQQTAIAEILRVISSSPGDVRPMLNAVAERALKLCDATESTIVLVDGDRLRCAALFGHTPTLREGEFMPLTRGSITGRAILDRTVIHMEDLAAASEEAFPVGRELQRRFGHRAILSVPLMREDRAIGAIALWRMEVRPFTGKQIALVKTFADQAAIAIENVRLFNETKEALEQQTAIAEILRVISGSPTDVQPVLDAIAERAARLCDASAASMYLTDGGMLRHLASKGPSADPVSNVDALPINRESVSGRALLDRKTIEVRDMEAEGSEYPLSQEIARRFGHRTVIVTPMFREGTAVGTILLRRQEVRPFSEREIALLATFGDQAAIALENVRLFNETKEALDQQRASGEVLSAISSSIADTKPVFDVILKSCERLFAGQNVGVMLVRDDGTLDVAAYTGPGVAELGSMFPRPLARDSGAGMAILERRLVHLPDIEAEGVPPMARDGARALGNRSLALAPMLSEGRAIGALWVGRSVAGPFSDKQIALLKTFAEQAVIAIQNARLFREIQDKSRQLEIADKHKSDFLANMSHELRTPLNAIIGFSEVLLEKMFGEVNDKQEDYLKDIHSSGKHLLGLINDILDLSKIEAGRMDLDRSSFEVEQALSNALTLIRERAHRHGIALTLDADPKLGEIVADERKLKQILLNLLSNAVKFTPDGGRVGVIARREPGRVVIAVRDTGIGIAPEDQDAVFEEFRQVGTDYTRKQEGTGLGLALARKFVELHGGKITLESTPGKGSTFTFWIPTDT